MSESGKYDVRKVHQELYAPPRRFVEVDVPAMAFLAIDGHGDPDGPDFAAAVEALYSVAYTVKFAVKKADGRDAVVAPLEGVWWADDPAAFTTDNRAAWRWTAMIHQPEWVDRTMVADAVAAVRTKKGAEAPAALDRVELRSMHEGRCVQVMHVGPFAAEGPVLAELHTVYLPEHGLTHAGEHHEIYLSDPRRTAPEKLRTILRQPVRPVEPR